MASYSSALPPLPFPILILLLVLNRWRTGRDGDTASSGSHLPVCRQNGGKKQISRQAELCPSWAVPLTPSLAPQLACRGSSAPCWPRSSDCADSQRQSTAELKDPSSYLKASQNDYLREMFASFKFRFKVHLGRCGVGSAQFTVHASLLASCILLQVWRKERDAEQELFSMHLCGEKNR